MDTFIGTARVDGAGNSSSPASTRRRVTDAPNLVSQGVIKPDTARLLVQRYLNHLDHFLYGLASRYDDIEQIHGMDITFVTTASRDDVAFALLRELGMPFKGEERPRGMANAS